ncbi:MAG: PhnD/SsuA/transferrin family substrate-binding protein [Anaerolineales bacterium]|nr:MAG: PhnD/SsuA/transferrin family substrate-binding protein [Anaerolineales bacterium]
MKLSLTSIQAPNQDRIAAALAGYLQDRTGIPVDFKHELTWQERLRLLDAGEIDIGWICGLPYIQRADQPVTQIELLVAPVMRAERYQNQPVYFSDVIVRKESPYQSIDDLRGKSWAYNEPGSHSGYNLTRFMLAKMGAYSDYFAPVVEAGSHQTALELLLAGKIEATAIDSTVLEIELEERPEIVGQIRTLTTWGPSPIPPWVIQKKLPARLKTVLREALLSLDNKKDFQHLFTNSGLKGFVQVNDQDYNPIREMYQIAQTVQL